MALGLPALCACFPLPPGIFLELISVTGQVDPRAIVQLEGLGQLKTQIHQYFNVYSKCVYHRFVSLAIQTDCRNNTLHFYRGVVVTTVLLLI
jgi:hypothetical protein